MPIPLKTFVERMTSHWTKTLGNIASYELQNVWEQLGEWFNQHIYFAEAGMPEARTWVVLQPPTGSGKTQGLAVYCSLLPRYYSKDEIPGILILTRRIKEADVLVETINTLAGTEVAVADHSENRAGTEKLFDTPIVVITHKAYTDGIEAVSFEWPWSQKWNDLITWRNGERQLTVIDESLDIVRHAQITKKDIDYVLRAIPEKIWYRYKGQRRTLENLRLYLKELEQERKEPGSAKEEMLWMGEDCMPDIELDPLRRKLKDIEFDKHLLRKEDPIEREQVRKIVDGLLYQLNIILNNWYWYARSQAGHSLNSAFSLLLPNKQGGIILDATASSNLLYKLMFATFVIQPPAEARRYQNVTLHYALGHAVGKSSLLKKPSQSVSSLLASLKKELNDLNRSVLVCCHQALEPTMISLGSDCGFQRFDVGHWQALDGRNDWQDFDTVVLFGLPYLPETWSANTFMALQDVQDTEWLRNSEKRGFKEWRDIRTELELGQLTVSIVQAINRIRCRRVIDVHGNCPDADVFILLPHGDAGRTLLSNIVKQMPGIRLLEWQFETTKREPRRSNHEEALFRYVSSMPVGRYAFRDVAQQLKISGNTSERIAAKLKDPENELSLKLAEKGVQYQVMREGRTQRAYLYKS
ncbi:MAG: hypothetical protein K0Q50_545 [Vampirovibrio sp.]|jgi:hypothetical protein|nr:hypothetical protein [Vampirovibrio sp.]